MTLPEAKDTLNQILITPIKEMSIGTQLTYVEAFRTVIADEDPDDFRLHRERLFSIFDRLHRHLLLLQSADSDTAQQFDAISKAETNQTIENGPSQQDIASSRAEMSQTVETKTDIEKQTIEETEYERIIEAMRFITYGIDFVPTPRHESTLLSLQH